MRGYQKRVIYMKNPGSAVFEEAYFVLRDGEETAGGTFDIIEEANRIIKENTDEEKRFDLASKICSAAKECSSVQELTDRVCDKRYTRARVRRALICGVLGVTKERMAQDAEFVTLLACSPVGREYLSSYKGALKVITRKSELGLSDGAASQYALSAKADMLYNRILSNKSVQIIKKPYICE